MSFTASAFTLTATWYTVLALNLVWSIAKSPLSLASTKYVLLVKVSINATLASVNWVTAELTSTCPLTYDSELGSK